MPRRIIRSAHIAHLAGADQGVQSLKRFIQGRPPIPFVNLIEIDPVCAESSQTFFALADQMITGNPAIVWAGAHYHPRFGRDQQIISTPFQYLAQYFLRNSVRISVRGVKEINAGFQAKIDLTARTLDIGGSYLAEKSTATKGHGA